jgi:transporter family protein
MWVIYSLSAAIMAAIVIVLSKRGISDTSPILVFGIEVLCMMVITWSIIIADSLQNQMRKINGRVWIFILIAGALTTFSSLASFHSLKLGHASRTASFEKISLVFSVLLSVVFLKDKFNWQLVAGVALMVAGSLFIAFSDSSK